ncbi:MAG: bifunctional phosphoglucose/phosphomannose isomerase [Flavobacteriales bacterium]
MEELIDGFPGQLTNALRIASEAQLSSYDEGIGQVCISGLGGSGIGGTLVSEWTASEAKVPVHVNKDYQLPAWVGPGTLLIISSYSGNTEETLSALEEGIIKNARIVCISSGGEVERIAGERSLDHIKIPEGYPPRAAMGYSIVQLLRILTHHGVIPAHMDMEREVRAAAELLELDQQPIKDHAKELADKIQGKRALIYAGSSYEGVAVRWRQQFNENAKTLCWHHALPEMNHNELVGWERGGEGVAVLMLRNSDDHERTQKRMELTKDFLKDRSAIWEDLWSRGESRIQRAFYLIHLGDHLSYHLAVLNGVDPIEVDVIERFKKRLKEA